MICLTTKFDWKDLIERAGWTLAQIAAGLTAADLAGLPEWLAAPIAVVLSIVKTAVKAKFTKDQ